MFLSVEGFLNTWKDHSAGTRKLMAALTDASLSQSVADGHRDLGRVAWHITQSLGEMAGRTGLRVDCPSEQAAVPASAAAVVAAYEKAASSLAREIEAHWTDETLSVEDDMYGMRWPRGFTLFILVCHEIHHRGQMTVLMRQAGLKVPGIHGPAKEEWAAHGMKAPEV